LHLDRGKDKIDIGLRINSASALRIGRFLKLYAARPYVDNMSILHRSMLLAALLLYFVSLTHGAQIAYCSPDNTGADTGFQAGTEEPPPLYFVEANAV
jgi:hypothetical protein